MSATHPPTSTTARPVLAIDQLVARGSVAGLFGGLFFILANMLFANAHGKPPVAPFLSISTIFFRTDKPMMTPEAVVTGLVLHVFLSMVFGVVFAVVVLPFLRNNLALLIGGLVYGLALYLVNFQVLGRLFFPFFVSPMGPNQGFELWIHPVAYGLLLVPFFLGAGGRVRSARRD